MFGHFSILYMKELRIFSQEYKLVHNTKSKKLTVTGTIKTLIDDNL